MISIPELEPNAAQNTTGVASSLGEWELDDEDTMVDELQQRQQWDDSQLTCGDEMMRLE